VARVALGSAEGDPETPALEAFVGDPIVIRSLVAGTNEVHTLHVDGHWFRAEPWSETSPPIGTIAIGISERYDLVIPRAGGPQRLAGDYFYYSGRSAKLREGAWGVIRVHDGTATSLKQLPGRELPRAAPTVCPDDAPRKSFAVSAIEAPLPMLAGARGKLYVLSEDRAAIRAGRKPPEPLVLRINVGDCVVIDLANETSGPASFYAGMLAHDPRDIHATAPEARRRYTYFAHPEVGETAALVRDTADIFANVSRGLYGAIIVGPRGARYRHAVTGEEMSAKAGWRADVLTSTGPPFRDFALFLQDHDDVIGTAVMPYTEDVKGAVALNYRAAPLKALTKNGRTMHREPATPLLEAVAGDLVKIHLLLPWSEQAQVFSLEGHRWPFEPARRASNLLSSSLVGGMEALTLVLTEGAGGPGRLAGDYLYGNHREAYREAGMWGIFRVHDSLSVTKLRPLRSYSSPE